MSRKKKGGARQIGRPQPAPARPPATAPRTEPAPQAQSTRAVQNAQLQTPPGAAAAASRLTGASTQASTEAVGESAASRPLRKDQERALRAYQWASAAKVQGERELKDYAIAVQGFAAALLRSGFAVAVSALERNADRKAFAMLLEQLATWPLPGRLAEGPVQEWPGRVRGIADASEYMQATRELVALLGWLRRACRAVGGGES